MTFGRNCFHGISLKPATLQVCFEYCKFLDIYAVTLLRLITQYYCYS